MLTALVLMASIGARTADPLAAGFANPPLSARPQTWWHWMNGNVTKAGITADLEAMKQVGIGGAQMFTVDQGIPPGPAKYGGPLWRELTAYAVKEAARLGMDLAIHNGAGWSSSGGPWVKPEDAMQVIAWSQVKVDGPKAFSEDLPAAKAPHVESVVPFYRDIAVFAYKTPEAGDVVSPLPNDFLRRTGVERGDGLQVDLTPLTTDIAIPQSAVVMLTDKMDSNGHLTWDVPAGHWTILRMGYTPTGVHNHPAPPEGEGLEVDKLSKEALDHFWDGVLAKVVADVGPKGLKTLDKVLIDSYEVGTQNWSPKFREAFRNRRGYDPLPFLPVIAGRIIDSKEKSERFLWDLRRTIADLYADNYYGGLADLAHKNGIKFTTEPYGNGGFDTIQSGSRADIPMAEFWLGGGAMETTKMVSSIGHTYGRPIVGAESFTGDVMPGRWREEPYMLKALGDLAFCNGINRYIFHRYAMQPWLNLRPGMTMGPWGTHLERTQTWWTEAATWLKYVARCQYLLQAGRFQADVCYYYGENSPNDLAYRQGLQPALPAGYDYDGCDADTLKKMSVKNGRIVLPSGMSYRLLVLPPSKFMTPPVARKLAELVEAGATVYGPKPSQSPSLTGYPACDAEVQSIADALWGHVEPTSGFTRTVGKGHVIANTPIGTVLRAVLGVRPDFEAPGIKSAFIHRKFGDADVYFVSNQRNRSGHASCTFREAGRVPELWHPETGQMEVAPVYRQTPQATTIPLDFDSAESLFVVFRKPSRGVHATMLEPASSAEDAQRRPIVRIDSARYESADGRGADVTDKVRQMVQEGETEIPATNNLFGDPVVNVVKQLTVSYTLNGKSMKQTAAENDAVQLTVAQAGGLEPKSYEVKRLAGGELAVLAWKGGDFLEMDSRGRAHRLRLEPPVASIQIQGPWPISFPPNLGAPASATFDNLASWTTKSDPGIKYFSGSATYTKDFAVPQAMLSSGVAVRLDLGEVKNLATVTLNGRQIAVLWKPPFALDVTGLVHKGVNRLQVKVTNLWPNRIIGDEQLPPDVEWQDDHLKRWPDWLTQGKPRPKTGRVTFETWHFYDKSSPLLDSGLIGPVTLKATKPLRVPL